MKKSVIKEVENLIKRYQLNCSVEEFREMADWRDISCGERLLSEDFIREFKDYVIWGDIASYQKLSEKFMIEFEDELDWSAISGFQVLPEKFIEKYKDKLDWHLIVEHQKLSCKFIEKHKDKALFFGSAETSQTLSEKFIEKFKDELDWNEISRNQKLSERFIRKFENGVYWENISAFQNLSEKFIRDFLNELDLHSIGEYQNLSLEFCKEFRLDCDIPKLHKKINPKKNALAYAKKHKLKTDKKYLYAFRNHDMFGKGAFSDNIHYKKGKYYRDWHCDPRKDLPNSYGLGIWPKGDTPVKVKLDDFCIAVRDSKEGKARVWGFEII